LMRVYEIGNSNREERKKTCQVLSLKRFLPACPKVDFSEPWPC
jgi:hypothetical protein